MELFPMAIQVTECVIYDVVFVPIFKVPKKSVHVQLSSLLTLAQQDNQWKVPTLCTHGSPVSLFHILAQIHILCQFTISGSHFCWYQKSITVQ